MISTFFFFLVLNLGFISSQSTNTTVSCPLDFTILSRLSEAFRSSKDPVSQCKLILQGIRLVQSDYLHHSNSFFVSTAFTESCWQSLQSVFNEYPNNFNIQSTCGFQTQFITQGCHNITTRGQYESKNSQSTLNSVMKACKKSLQDRNSCAECSLATSGLRPSDSHEVLPSDVIGWKVYYESDCVGYRWMYAAAFGNSYGPTDRHTSDCLLALTFDMPKSRKKHRKTMIFVFLAFGFLVLVMAFVGILWMWRYKLNMYKRQNKVFNSSPSDLEMIGGDTRLIKFSFSEVQKATSNFSVLNMIGRGKYGNVFKGVLPDGTEVAVKRFKNCSVAGDASFVHEVEVIASVLHVNLVALRGYCIAITKFEGCQRIIVCDLMKNGSLHDHLFGSAEKKLSWPIRQKIALGTARGLAYLHYGAQPAIIHRDIKGCNILLDDDFEPKVADFGLAKFAPEGVSHMSTRVAGTMGYVAPEYSLYGKLTERSDVYSFGVVLLELLSGKKALLRDGDDQHTLVADWAWSLVKTGRALDIVEVGIPELGPPEVIEKYVLLAVLCCHPQLYARPTMDQVVKILDSNFPVPVIPDRSIPVTSAFDDIQKFTMTNYKSQTHI
ncbi:putative LRR receptor-like serine/threonine-protein kinase RKF3 [Heracleum sosnowskyi]|uniref:non-specific serine/threonine protein kinase n=1 Tax=Heracleum sosnowskyi TaxID=360622 RepID=A0AAD8GPE8_9APIA|nr:putative LRR receptor-like serine/threonine-protein kinase RKF3 [Heracleum sosnowskyi]